MRSFDVTWRYNQEKRYHLAEEAQRYLIEVNVFCCALKRRKSESGVSWMGLWITVWPYELACTSWAVFNLVLKSNWFRSHKFSGASCDLLVITWSSLSLDCPCPLWRLILSFSFTTLKLSTVTGVLLFSASLVAKIFTWYLNSFSKCSNGLTETYQTNGGSESKP